MCHIPYRTYIIGSGKTDPDEKWGRGVNLFIMEMDDDVIDIINLYANYY